MKDYVQAGISHLLVDPDDNFIYTKRKGNRLSSGNERNELTKSNLCALENAKNVAFPVTGWSTSLAKSPMFTRAEIDRYVCISGKTYRNIGHHSLPSGLNKAEAFLADEYLHEMQTRCDQRYFCFRAKCFHSFKVHETPYNLKLALCIVSGEVEYAY